ncbi:hypothetical protein B0A49_05709 [Cryomyces minteri]|uniref:F-box domain-containing protein n=1 Tax=Cryomyces minteri TaxID=331657 RepID=A0A4U0XF30_9PEZI|nr:hypothetical protein B0A49_05709 [Cryomyces minteri]
MVSFLDLPEADRQAIYRLHLHFDSPVTLSDHNAVTTLDATSKRHLRAILKAHKFIAKEAAHIYYSENNFHMNVSADVISFVRGTDVKHSSLIKRLTFNYGDEQATKAFRILRRLKELDELCIGVDERAMVAKVWAENIRLRWYEGDEITPQINLKVLLFTGMDALREIKHIRLVKFVRDTRSAPDVVSGPIPGGVLETMVAPCMMATRELLLFQARISAGPPFPFQELPPELRNHIYAMVLHVDGGVAPSKQTPTSCFLSGSRRRSFQRKPGPSPPSVLSIFATSRAIYRESAHLFYSKNHLIFRDAKDLVDFLNETSEFRRNYIEEVTVWYRHPSNAVSGTTQTTLGPLTGLTGLRKLHIVFESSYANHFHVDDSIWDVVHPLNTQPSLATLASFNPLNALDELTVRDRGLDVYLRRVGGGSVDQRGDTFSIGWVRARAGELERFHRRYNKAYKVE